MGFCGVVWGCVRFCDVVWGSVGVVGGRVE